MTKKKNKYLLEVARAISFTTKVLKYIWGEIVLTITYLINRLPMRILDFKKPIKILNECFPTTRLTIAILFQILEV